MNDNLPLIEFDDDPDSLINPHRDLQALEHMPEHVVLCFFPEIVTKYAQDAEVIRSFGGEVGPLTVYALEYKNRKIAIIHPKVGAPVAVRAMEEVIAIGGRKFIAVGGCGVLQPDIALGEVIIVNSAVRDEGVSYHYAPPSREIEADKTVVEKIANFLKGKNIPYQIGKTWTTSAVFRETSAKIARRKNEGCLVVEMEASALIAAAQFRGVQFGQILYSGDDVSGNKRDSRNWRNQPDIRENLFRLAIDTVLEL